jgi:hypothetical protein
LALTLVVALAAGALPCGRGSLAGLRGLLPVLLALLLGFGPWGAVAAGAAAVAGAWLSPAGAWRSAAGGAPRPAQPRWRRAPERRGATVAFGALLGMSPLAVLWAFAAGGAVAALTRRRPLGAVAAAAAVPPLMWAFRAPGAYGVFAALAFCFVVYRHRRSLAGFLPKPAEQR